MQEDFDEWHRAFQCPYCTPGFFLITVAMLEVDPSPPETETRDHLAGNLRRYGSNRNILEPVRSLAERAEG